MDLNKLGDLDLEMLEELAELARKKGITRLRVGDLEFEIGPVLVSETHQSHSAPISVTFSRPSIPRPTFIGNELVPTGEKR